MNSKNVLNRILTMLSVTESNEEKFTYAKLADGTIVESPTFDVGEPLDVVTEEGKSPAPDGIHELTLRDDEGNEVLFKVKTENGIIVERENVELESVEEEIIEEIKEEAIEEMVAGLIEALTPDEVDSEVAEEIAEKVLDALEDKIEILKKRKMTKMESVTEEEMESEVSIPTDFEKTIETLSYRIEELEKKMEELAAVKEEVVDKDPTMEIELEEEELPKLDGAPIESNFSKMKNTNKEKPTVSTQAMFLSKLYN